MVHVIKGRQYSAYIYTAYTLIPVPQSQRWSLRLTLNLDSDKPCFDASIRDEIDSAVQLLNFSGTMVLYIAQG